uniref:PDZ domain-containing protein n=1 Tax=Periophthalmus magnuspinnatus TaxID=409849 RepID=A0A3B4B6L9_9GOBI
MSCFSFTFNPKEGIDNPALNINDDDEQVVVPRLLHLHRIEGQSFGFSIRWDDGLGSSEGGGPEGGLEVSVVQPFGQAEQCGLRLGDRILEVNEEDVINTDFNKVCAVSSDLDLKSLVKSFKGENFYRPKLCHIKRDPEHGLGFNLITLEGHRGQFIVSTDSRGPAERAGVCSGDKLIWINGTRASSLTQSALNRMMRKNPDSVTLLVINSVSEECFIKRKMHIVPEVAECRNFPHKARTMNLAKGKDGYGFLLRQERIAFSDRTVHVLREVDSGSPAEEAGMEDGDLLLAVNSEPVESMEHEEIVKLIRQSGDRVSLTVLSMSARDFYRQVRINLLNMYANPELHQSQQYKKIKLGIPPLLFHQDLEESCNENVTQNQVILTSHKAQSFE